MIEKLKPTEQFYKDLLMRESSGNYHSVNNDGYLGAFQMGESALADVGYYKRNPHRSTGSNLWDGKWLGKDGIWCKEDFLNNPAIQRKAVREFHKKNWQYIQNNNLGEYVGKIINGVEITPSGMLAGAHLVGAGGLTTFLKSNGKIVPKDGNSVPVTHYMKKFKGYDTYEITKIPTYEKFKEERGIQEPKYTPDVVTKTYSKSMDAKIEKEREYYSKVLKEYHRHVKDVIKYGDRANIEDRAFIEGFNSGSIIPNKSNKIVYSKTNSTDPNNGRWITTKQGKHVFIEK